jgi:hypothetical protein
MNKLAAYKFLQQLVEKYPGDAVPMLQDIIVDYLLFPHGDGENPPMTALNELDREVADLMVDPSQKIRAIKLVREKLNIGLKEAKDYVEQRAWPVTTNKNEKIIEMQARFVQTVLEKVRKDYNLTESE